jgi:hypothetical protein
MQIYYLFIYINYIVLFDPIEKLNNVINVNKQTHIPNLNYVLQTIFLHLNVHNKMPN